ncbi:unnamed protein product [Caretta caretta]
MEEKSREPGLFHEKGATAYLAEKTQDATILEEEEERNRSYGWDCNCQQERPIAVEEKAPDCEFIQPEDKHNFLERNIDNT